METLNSVRKTKFALLQVMKLVLQVYYTPFTTIQFWPVGIYCGTVRWGKLQGQSQWA